LLGNIIRPLSSDFEIKDTFSLVTCSEEQSISKCFLKLEYKFLNLEGFMILVKSLKLYQIPSRDHLLGKLLGAKSNTTRQEALVKGSSALGTGVVRFRILSSVGGCCLVA